MAVLGRTSDFNLIQGNLVTDSASIENGDINGVGENLHSNAFSDPALPDRGSSLVGNRIVNNTVLNAYANGVSNLANTQAQIIGNLVDGSGVGDPAHGIGIGIQPRQNSTLHTDDLIESNTTSGNVVYGLQDLADGNRYIDNTATGNGVDDLAAGACQSIWLGNTYGTADNPCATADGHRVSPPATSASAAAVSLRQAAPSAREGIPPRIVRGG